MKSKHVNSAENNSFSSYFGISNKILLIVLLTIFLFTIGLSVSVGVTSFRKFTAITMNELNRMSAVFARNIEELESNSRRLVRSVYGNKQFLEQIKQLSNKGPSYALDTELMDQDIEESERIYFFQAQLNLINTLQPLLNLNSLDNIVLYLTSPFGMVKITEAIPVLIINGDYIFVNQFKQKGRIKNSKWYKIETQSYTHPSPDYFDISSVYSQPVETFFNDMGFRDAGRDEVSFPVLRPELSGPIGSDVRIIKNISVFKAWHSIVSEMANPETFEEEPVVTGYIVVEQELSQAKINRFSDELGMDLGIASHGKLLMSSSDTEDGEYSLQANNRVRIDGISYYFSSKNISVIGLADLEAVIFSPVSVLNEYTRSLSSQIAFTGIAVMLIAGTLIFFVVQTQIRNPLKKLMDGVSLIAEGKFECKVNIDTKDELGKLAFAFNNMSSTLRGKTDALYKTVSELEKAQNYISNIINSMPSILIGVDASGRVTQWNNRAEETIGINADKAKGRSLVDIFPQMASEMEKITESIRTREIKQEQKMARQSESGICYEDVTIYPLIANGVEGVVIRIDDVTDKVRMEEMMIQSEKMLSVGGLAAGMAHEINNPMAGMMQTADVMSNRLTNLEMPANRRAAEEAGTTMEVIRTFMDVRGIPQMITTINKSGRRVAEIVANILSFARKSEAQVFFHDFAELLDKTLELAATDYDIGKHHDFRQIEIRKEYEAGIPAVPCEGAKIQQVLLNVFRNGAQAMQEAGTSNPRFIVRTHFKKDQEMACIEIEDNGPGMDEATRKRVFEPFFTTKPVGIGTGLGLSVSYFIITENHGGEMSVESAPGSGAKFIIRLPLERNT